MIRNVQKLYRRYYQAAGHTETLTYITVKEIIDKKTRYFPWAGYLCWAILHRWKAFTVKQQQEVLRLTLRGSNGLSLQLWKSSTKGSWGCYLWDEWNKNSSSDVTDDPPTLLNAQQSVSRVLSPAWPHTLGPVDRDVITAQSWAARHHHTHKQHCIRHGWPQKPPAENGKWKHSLARTALG